MPEWQVSLQELESKLASYIHVRCSLNSVRLLPVLFWPHIGRKATRLHQTFVGIGGQGVQVPPPRSVTPTNDRKNRHCSIPLVLVSRC